MNTPTPPPTALEASLSLIDLGPFGRPRDSQKWLEASRQMARHCAIDEDTLEAAARIVAAEYRRAHAALLTIEERYIDGCVTLDDYLFMGNTARGYFDATPNQ